MRLANESGDREDETTPSMDRLDALRQRARRCTRRRAVQGPQGHRMSHFATACELRDAFRAGERSAHDICQDTLDRIAASDHAIHAFNTVAGERALERADALDRDRGAWRDRPLAGVPIALKDNICTRGLRTTASSKILETFVPPYDATVVDASRGGRRDRRRQDQLRRVRDGVVHRELRVRSDEEPVGAWIARRADRAAGRPSPWRPAWRPSRSARIPAARSGSPRRSAASSASSRPTGACRDTDCWRSGRRSIRSARSRSTVADAAIALSVIAGADRHDATSAADDGPGLRRRAQRRRARPADRRPVEAVDGEGIDDEVRRRFRAALDTLADRGASLVDVELPHASAAIPVYYLVATAEASSNLARYDGVRYGLARRGGTRREPDRTTISTGCTRGHARRASAPRSSGASCSARTC